MPHNLFQAGKKSWVPSAVKLLSSNWVLLCMNWEKEAIMLIASWKETSGSHIYMIIWWGLFYTTQNWPCSENLITELWCIYPCHNEQCNHLSFQYLVEKFHYLFYTEELKHQSLIYQSPWKFLCIFFTVPHAMLCIEICVCSLLGKWINYPHPFPLHNHTFTVTQTLNFFSLMLRKKNDKLWITITDFKWKWSYNSLLQKNSN